MCEGYLLGWGKSIFFSSGVIQGLSTTRAGLSSRVLNQHTTDTMILVSIFVVFGVCVGGLVMVW